MTQPTREQIEAADHEIDIPPSHLDGDYLYKCKLEQEIMDNTENAEVAKCARCGIDVEESTFWLTYTDDGTMKLCDKCHDVRCKELAHKKALRDGAM